MSKTHKPLAAEKRKILFPYSKHQEFYSVSSLTTALECTLKHWFKYSVGLPVRDSENLVFGRCIHQVLEHYHAKMKGRPPSEDDIYVLYQLFDDLWTEKRQLGLPTGKTEYDFEYYRNLAFLILDRYLHYRPKVKNPKVILFQDKHMTYPKPAVELEFRVPLIDLRTGKQIVNKDLYGFIDLIEYDDEHGIVVWDHKTTAMEFTQFRLLSDIQLTLYAYVFRYLSRMGAFVGIDPGVKESKVGFNLLIKPRRNVKIIGVDHSKIKSAKFKKVVRTVTDQEIAGVMNIIKNIDFILSTNRPYPSWSSDCTWKCDFAEYCIQYRNGEFVPPKEEQAKKSLAQELDLFAE
jgi:hypothetical protein